MTLREIGALMRRMDIGPLPTSIASTSSAQPARSSAST